MDDEQNEMISKILSYNTVRLPSVKNYFM